MANIQLFDKLRRFRSKLLTLIDTPSVKQIFPINQSEAYPLFESFSSDPKVSQYR